MAKKHDPVLVVGLGRFGIALARELERNGIEVLGVDNSDTTVQRLAGMLNNIVIADGTDMQALEEIGAGEFPRAVVAIGTMESNILATSNLAELGVGSIWAKALSRQHAQILKRVGAHEVVQPEHDMGRRIAHLVSGDVLDYMQVAPNWVIAKTRPVRFIVGVDLGQTHLRERYRITVIAVKPQGHEYFRHAERSTRLAGDDEILVMGTIDDVNKFANMA